MKAGHWETEKAGAHDWENMSRKTCFDAALQSIYTEAAVSARIGLCLSGYMPRIIPMPICGITQEQSAVSILFRRSFSIYTDAARSEEDLKCRRQN